MDYAFHCYNGMAETGATVILSRLLGTLEAPPVILCIGSDLAIGDSLGPITGTLIRKSARGLCGYVYGSLRKPMTAKEMRYIVNFLKQTYPRSKVIAIDAALGAESEIGLFKISDEPLHPGSGAKKKLDAVGDVSILGIVAKKTNFSYSTLNSTRLNIVYSLAESISGAVVSYLIKEQNFGIYKQSALSYF